MKRIKHVAWLCAPVLSTLAGYAISPGGSLAAQAPAPPAPGARTGPSFQSGIPAPQLSQPVPLWPNQPKDASYWSIDDIRKAHRILSAADASGREVDPNSTLHDFPYWTRTHSLFVVHCSDRPGACQAAHQHAGYAQFIVIMGGTGTVVAGGELQDRAVLTEGVRQFPGEYRGASIAGGERFQVQEGDWLSIPPDAPAQFRADAGGLTYMVMKVNAMLYPWDLIR